MRVSALKLLLVTVVIFPYSDGAQKELEFSTIGSFQPVTDVRDHAAIDMDNALIETLLEQGRFDDAKQVYIHGAFSRSYADLKFGFQGLPADIAAHTPITVKSKDEKGVPLKGMLLEHGKLGDKMVRILYNQNENEHPCYVGGHPEPVLDGCFPPTGFVHFDHLDKNISYSYSQHLDNLNDRVLQWFSIHAKIKMKPCPNCQYFKQFDRFYQFYGQTDYANKWIMTALDGDRAAFDSSAADFQNFDLEARAAAVNKAIVTMSMSMYVIREMEDAIKECKKTCESGVCSDKAEHTVDAAAAMYIGSLEGPDGSGNGKLMYSVADIECKEFKTCGVNGDKTKGTSKANIEIIRGLQEMQANVTTRACPEARVHKDHITRWMTVPLIQGTLRYAYMRSSDNDISDVDKAIGAAYAASIVPLVAACSYKDAKIISDAMEPTATTTDFAMVKEAFERHYSCLGVRCKHIGGYWDKHSHNYFYGADPCSFDITEEEIHAQELKRKKTLGWLLGIPLALACALLIYKCKRRAEARKADMDDFSDSSSYDDFIT